MDRLQLPFLPVFVGGAPRSGTTLLHALICTSPSVNAYVGECSYLTRLAWAYVHGLEHFDIHTKFHFPDRAAFEAYHAALLSPVLEHYWRSLDAPKLLALKDPNLTILFPAVARWFPQARFVVAVRDPRDVVASRIQVQRRSAAGPVEPGFILQVVNEYVSIYRNLMNNRAGFGGRLCLVSYEELVSRRDCTALARFLGLDDLDAAAVWQRSVVPKETYAANPWNTPLYHQPITAESVGNFRAVLDEATSAEVLKRCEPVYGELRTAIGT